MIPRLCAVALVVAAATTGCERATLSPPALVKTAVGRTVRSWVDDSRPAWTGSGPRPLAVQLWYPAEGDAREQDWYLGPPNAPLFRAGRSAEDAALASTPATYPLVLLSHGTGGSSVMLAWLGEALARSGYVVAAVNHHGNTSAESAPTPQGFMLWWERALDLSKVLDHVIADAEFGRRIDPDRVGAAGFSLGGYTVAAIAGAQTSLAEWQQFCETAQRDPTCAPQPEYPEAFAEFAEVRAQPVVQASLARHGNSYRDARFKAVYAIAPVGSWLTAASLAQVRVPVRVVVGDQDRTAPAATNAERIAKLIPGAELSVLRGAGHYTFLAECLPAGVSALPGLCREQPDVDRAVIHRDVSADAVAFFERTLVAR